LAILPILPEKGALKMGKNVKAFDRPAEPMTLKEVAAWLVLVIVIVAIAAAFITRAVDDGNRRAVAVRAAVAEPTRWYYAVQDGDTYHSIATLFAPKGADKRHWEAELDRINRRSSSNGQLSSGDSLLLPVDSAVDPSSPLVQRVPTAEEAAKEMAASLRPVAAEK